MTGGRYDGRLRRVDYRNGGHGYMFGNVKATGVTTAINGGYPKPGLTASAAKIVGRAAADDPTVFAHLTGDEAERVAVKLYTDQWNAARDRGKYRHEYADKLLRGERVDVPAEHAKAVDQYVAFATAWRVDPMHTEVVVGNRTHGYAGQADLLAWIDGGAVLMLGDLKTGASGIWPETALQLAAYRHAEVLLDADGRERPMPRVDLTAAVWLQDDTYEVVPVDTGPDVFAAFLAVVDVARFAARKRDAVVGVPLLNPLVEAS